jgi:two-component system cell cycle sensor histidine kinase/response regulator CckA
MPQNTSPAQIVPRILIVEDDYQLADLLSEVLIRENLTPDLAANGMEALEKLREMDYEAVVCDLMMPRVDGQALYNTVAREFPHLAGRFLFVTGQAVSRSGFTDFVHRSGSILLEKPFDIEQLRASLKELLAR